MCRNIKKLRPPITVDPGPDDFHAAALQYVRKVSGLQKPSVRDQAAFDQAVEAIADATAGLLGSLHVGAAHAGAAHEHADAAPVM
jgi:hypothetical protein